MISGAIATIQIVYDGTPEEMTEFLTNLLSVHTPAGVLDWTYLKLGGQWMYPSSKHISEDYEEGEAFE